MIPVGVFFVVDLFAITLFFITAVISVGFVAYI